MLRSLFPCHRRNELAEALKDSFGFDVAEGLAADLKKAWKAFPSESFLGSVFKGYEDLELMDRVRHIARGLEGALPNEFLNAKKIIEKSLGEPLETTSGNGMEPFRYLCYGFWVSEKGLANPKEALDLQRELTRRCTSEFSVRVFLKEHYSVTLEYLGKLVTHPCPHVRRWVSEGTRPHLPWGQGVPELRDHPEKHLHLLEALKDDENIYVRKSVANHLNDFSRNHPQLLVKIAKAWSKNASEGRSWVIKQALRTLVKKGDRRALSILGYGKEPKIEIRQESIVPLKVERGGQVEIEWTLVSAHPKPQPLMVDMVVTYPRRGGKSFSKTFKLKQLELSGGEVIEMKKKISLKDLSTRRHEPGEHQVGLLINGRSYGLGKFQLKA